MAEVPPKTIEAAVPGTATNSQGVTPDKVRARAPTARKRTTPDQPSVEDDLVHKTSDVVFKTLRNSKTPNVIAKTPAVFSKTPEGSDVISDQSEVGSDKSQQQCPQDHDAQDISRDHHKAMNLDSPDNVGGAAIGERLHFKPRDRVLFVHHGSNRVFEGSVTDVDRKYTHVEMLIPEDRRRPTGDKSRPPGDKTHRKRIIYLMLDVYRHFKDFELISLFRPTFPQLLTPPGFYLNYSTTDLWLELDDVFEIVMQGSIVEHRAETYEPQTFAARVTSVNHITCRILPIVPLASRARKECANKVVGNDARNFGDESKMHFENKSNVVKDVSAGKTATVEELLELDSASGFSPEWVPRNTLRFRRFIEKSKLESSSVKFTLVPSSISK
jgi:hypothetical protein